MLSPGLQYKNIYHILHGRSSPHLDLGIVPRSYGQYCSLARALDVVGERWTLLLVRELFVSPRRFTELLDGLSGIGRNLLAARLRHLEGEGILRRNASDPRLYELSEEGQALAPALTELSRWGAGRLGVLEPGEAFRGRWVMGTMSATADLDAARGVRETYQFDVEGDVFHLRVEDGEVISGTGAVDAPHLVISTSPYTMTAIAAGEQSVLEAVTDGGLRVEGSPAALEHALAIFATAWGTEPDGSG